MAVWSIIQFSELVNLRFDPEYYQPSYLALEKSLKAADPISIHDFAYVTDGIHGSPEWVDEGGTLYLSAKCVKDNYFVLADAGTISHSQNKLNPRTQARMQDVLLTTVGTIGNAAVVDETILPANMDRHLGIIRISEASSVDPYYLATFLNSNFGRFQTVRESTGNVQLNLFIEKIKNLLVPIGDHFNEIGKLTRKAYDKRRESESLYAEAEALLLHELGIDIVELETTTKYSVENLSDVIQADRLDAEYWHPVHVQNEKILEKASRLYPVKNVFDLVKRITGSAFYPSIAGYYSDNEGMPFIRVSDLSDFFINPDSLIRLPQEIVDKTTQIATVEAGDIVVAKGGSIGGACLVQPELGRCAVSRDVIAIKTDSEKIDSLYLVAFLKSRIGYLQLDRHKSQQVQAHLTFPAIGNVKIIVPPRDKQLRIIQHIKKADQTVQEANLLLERAKKRVEQMILGERTADEYPS